MGRQPIFSKRHYDKTKVANTKWYGDGSKLKPHGTTDFGVYIYIVLFYFIFLVCTIKKSPNYWDTQFWPIPIASSRSFKTPAMPRYPKSPVWSARADSPQELAGPRQNSSEASRFFTFSYISAYPSGSHTWLAGKWMRMAYLLWFSYSFSHSTLPLIGDFPLPRLITKRYA